jgi:plasmid stability protein
MSEPLLTNVNPIVLDQLNERATSHGRTPEEEAKSILVEALHVNGREDWAPVDAIYQRLSASGQNFSDSVEVLREDRGR